MDNPMKKNEKHDPENKEGCETSLVEAIRRETATGKHVSKDTGNAGNSQSKQDFDNDIMRDGRISLLEDMVLYLREENEELKETLRKLELEYHKYSDLKEYCAKIEARLSVMEEENRMLYEDVKITSELYNRLEERINQATQTKDAKEDKKEQDKKDPGNKEQNKKGPVRSDDKKGSQEESLDQYFFGEPLDEESSESKSSGTDAASAKTAEQEGLYSRICGFMSGLKDKISEKYEGFREYVRQRKKGIAIASVIGLASLAIALGLYYSRPDLAPQEPAPITQTVKRAAKQPAPAIQAPQVKAPVQEQYSIHNVVQGDTLWDITEDYLRSHDMDTGNSSIYTATDRLAELNGKGNQADYKVGVWDEKSPHCIRHGDQIKVWK